MVDVPIISQPGDILSPNVTLGEIFLLHILKMDALEKLSWNKFVGDQHRFNFCDIT